MMRDFLNNKLELSDEIIYRDNRTEDLKKGIIERFSDKRVVVMEYNTRGSNYKEARYIKPSRVVKL